MHTLNFQVQINSPARTVWNVLWQDATLREWAGIVDPGTYMVGELVEGATVQFNSAEGYGVTSLVAKLIPNEFILFRHKADTKDIGESRRHDQWTGGEESYTLTEKDGITTLMLQFDVPDDLVEVMNEVYPRALNRIKELAETQANPR